ncbi:hypothetical protein BB561_002402 [Smittium simulii]|uniref:Fanconi Anaemia group E protein C-terminal domain-containing protein n=1 Tax=Smittium simulii TaxID=133385 RepID=A0A2T9YQP7_9FUNG|nr:hypothetical protein BB561_002402 [Smittium simulii]
MQYDWPHIAALLSEDSEKHQLFQSFTNNQERGLPKHKIFLDEIEYGEYPSDQTSEKIKNERVDCIRTKKNDEQNLNNHFQTLYSKDITRQDLENSVQQLKSGKKLCKLEIISRELQTSLAIFAEKKQSLFIDGIFFTLLRSEITDVSMGDLMLSILKNFDAILIYRSWSKSNDFLDNPICTTVECNVLIGILSMNCSVEMQTVSSIVNCLARISTPNRDSKKFGMMVNTLAKKHANKMSKSMLNDMLAVADSLNTLFKKITSNLIKKLIEQNN